MSLLLWLLACAYASLTLTLWWAWNRLPRQYTPDLAEGPGITVVIPVRDEAASLPNLLADLARQTYPNFEVIVADDASSDATVRLATAYAALAPYPLTVLSLIDDPTVASPKKRAISQSIRQASGTLIVTTDGDCRVGPNWLSTIARCQQATEAKLLSGPVAFTTERSVFGSVQTVEFASLIGAGAATLSLGKPTMCNGANLCYQKAAFEAVNGFSGIDHLASGDDELLMHKMAARYPGEVYFMKNKEAIVETAAHQSWRAFYQQRKRWAGKWRAYSSLFPTMLAVLIFLCNLTPLVAVGWCLAGKLTVPSMMGILMLKLVPEWLFLGSVLSFLQKPAARWWIPATQIVYPFYVVFFGLAAQRPGILWKGRKLT